MSLLLRLLHTKPLRPTDVSGYTVEREHIAQILHVHRLSVRDRS
jgi:hypothetical protein